MIQDSLLGMPRQNVAVLVYRKAPKNIFLEEKLGDAMRYFVNHERRVNQNKSQIVC